MKTPGIIIVNSNGVAQVASTTAKVDEAPKSKMSDSEWDARAAQARSMPLSVDAIQQLFKQVA